MTLFLTPRSRPYTQLPHDRMSIASGNCASTIFWRSVHSNCIERPSTSYGLKSPRQQNEWEEKMQRHRTTASTILYETIERTMLLAKKEILSRPFVHLAFEWHLRISMALHYTHGNCVPSFVSRYCQHLSVPVVYIDLGSDCQHGDRQHIFILVRVFAHIFSQHICMNTRV